MPKQAVPREPVSLKKPDINVSEIYARSLSGRATHQERLNLIIHFRHSIAYWNAVLARSEVSTSSSLRSMAERLVQANRERIDLLVSLAGSDELEDVC